jgi:hypothetical protein
VGNVSKEEIEWYTPFHFRGSQIARGVLHDLVSHHGLADASQVVLASVSAGSFGALAHGNYYLDYLAEHAPKADFKVWLDSGFWLLNEPWRDSWAPMDCTTENWVDCRIDGCHTLTYEHFAPVYNEECVAAGEYTWECAFPEIVIPYLRFPMFVSQQQYDKLQLQGAGLGIGQQLSVGLDFTLERGQIWRDLLATMTENVWTSACRKHDIIDKEQVFLIELDNDSTHNKIMTANDAAVLWLSGEHVWAWDDCQSPDCNPTCPEM